MTKEHLSPRHRSCWGREGWEGAGRSRPTPGRDVGSSPLLQLLLTAKPPACGHGPACAQGTQFMDRPAYFTETCEISLQTILAPTSHSSPWSRGCCWKSTVLPLFFLPGRNHGASQLPAGSWDGSGSFPHRFLMAFQNSSLL